MRTLPAASFDQSYYATSYADYDRQNPPRKLAYYRDLVTRALSPSAATAPTVLDLGCAFGRFLAALDPRWQAFGADVSEFAIGRAGHLVPTAHVAVMRDGVIPFTERFDAITAWDVLEHVQDLDDIAAQVVAHLAADGVFAFAVPVFDGPLGLLVRRLDKDATHINRLSRRVWLDWARRHFDVLRWSGAFRYLLPSGHYIHWTSDTLRQIAPAVVVTARQRGSR